MDKNDLPKPPIPSQKDFKMKPYEYDTRGINAFKALVPDLSIFKTTNEFIDKCKQIAKKLDPSGMLVSSDLLFGYFGKEIIPHVMPDIINGHLKVDYKNGTMIPDNKDLLYSNLPASIDEVLLSAILGSMAKSMQDSAYDRMKAINQTTATRHEIARGRCEIVSDAIVKDLKTQFPQITRALGNIRIYFANRLSIKSPPYLYPLSDGHSILSIRFNQGQEPMVLVIDPTIAQVDMTNQYDLEYSIVKSFQFSNFLKLRYRTHINSTISENGYRLPIETDFPK